MHRSSRALALLVTGLTVVSLACGGDDDASSSPSTDATTMTDGTTMADTSTTGATTVDDTIVDDTLVEEGAPATTAAIEASEATMPLAEWQTLAITDVDGVTFTLGDYVGQPLLVEPFATWCSKCRAQLGDTQQAAATLGDEAAVVALSVETELDGPTVGAYAADNGWDDIRVAVMSPELLAALADEFGTSIANPPTTPKFIVDEAGAAGELTTGPVSAGELVTLLRADG